MPVLIITSPLTIYQIQSKKKKYFKPCKILFIPFYKMVLCYRFLMLCRLIQKSHVHQDQKQLSVR